MALWRRIKSMGHIASCQLDTEQVVITTTASFPSFCLWIPPEFIIPWLGLEAGWGLGAAANHLSLAL